MNFIFVHYIFRINHVFPVKIPRENAIVTRAPFVSTFPRRREIHLQLRYDPLARVALAPVYDFAQRGEAMRSASLRVIR